MKYLILLILLIAINPLVVNSQPIEPQYTIDHPRLVLHKDKKLLQIKWIQFAQSGPKRVIASKFTNTQQRRGIPCADIYWSTYIKHGYGYKYCYDLYHAFVPTTGWITVQDTHWQRNTLYMLIQYDFTTHNAPYIIRK